MTVETVKGHLFLHSETGTEGGHWALQDDRYVYPTLGLTDHPVRWSYYGLRVLNNGDHLKIIDPDNPDHTVWEGVIDLQSYDLFTEDAGGLWIHADQKGMDRDVWSRFFFDAYPAELTQDPSQQYANAKTPEQARADAYEGLWRDYQRLAEVTYHDDGHGGLKWSRTQYVEALKDADGEFICVKDDQGRNHLTFPPNPQTYLKITPDGVEIVEKMQKKPWL